MLRIRSYFTRSYMIFGFCSFVMLPVIGIQWLLTGYYGMNVCVPFLQIPMWKPSPSPCDGIRKWGLLEMIRMRWGQEGTALMNGISALTKPQENLLSLSALCHMRTQWGVGSLQPRIGFSNSPGTLILDFQPQKYEKWISVVDKSPNL